ncbi:peptidoglycan hydrolase FlgJ [Neiella marina]|uniref:Peptidoglycan hydrolase FlgJ n=1 Tax=Neiella marina TaxID=508461 RepID=A0A8J2UAG9_9GAMM|nr:flagellar assembly peptidoglycan hydrolase FlgJ [Neiella marina]GGA90394.1 peptidoglycan hydrolase FlgJ [Neiella marina]
MAISSSSNNAQTFGQASNYNDLASLDKLRSAAQKDEKSALREVAQQFESIFMQMVLKGMRQANAAFESDLTNSNYTNFYRDMADQQMSLNMAQQGALGLADVMVQQLSPEGNFTPASVMRSGSMPSESKTSLDARAMIDRAEHGKSPARSVNNAVASEANSTPQDISFSGPQDFVEKLMPMARKTAQALGVNPTAILAQAALETGWGQKIIRNMDGSNSFNLFNIKANSSWQGAKASVSTLEFENDLPVKKVAAFRSYQNLQDSFNDYENFLSNSSRYAESLSKKNDSAGFLQELQKAGYATDPRYAEKAVSVLNKITGMIEP